jgi:Xaa-Pro aminopeptidase
MNTQIRPPRIGPQPWEAVRGKLDQSLPFANMRDTPYYRDAVWEQFSKAEYERRYRALRAKMRQDKLDVVIVPGGPSHWSFGGGMLWLTGHWEWHALSSYVLVPLEGEPTMIYSMGGTHAEAVRRQVEIAVKDVRHSRGGRYADIMVERIRELKLERGRVGLMEIDPRHGDYMPVNQYHVLRDNLPDAELVFTKGFLHELLSIHSAEELDCVRKAGVLCKNAMDAMVARAAPGVKEYELRAAAGAAILEGGGDIDFLIIGSTPMDNPAMIFGNPRPSSRVLKKGDIINMELAAGYRGYTAQVGSPICVGEPTEMVKKFWNEVTLPGYHRIVAEIAPGKPVEAMRLASKFFRDNGYQSRPTQCHGIDLVTDKPHVVAEHVAAEEFEQILKAGMVIMAEPNPITPDGLFGIFLGHTFIVTESGHEVVDDFPLEIAVAGK